jgi:hypothetical protein
MRNFFWGDSFFILDFLFHFESDPEAFLFYETKEKRSAHAAIRNPRICGNENPE